MCLSAVGRRHAIAGQIEDLAAFHSCRRASDYEYRHEISEKRPGLVIRHEIAVNEDIQLATFKQTDV